MIQRHYVFVTLCCNDTEKRSGSQKLVSSTPDLAP